MKVTLIDKPTKDFSTIAQILLNRGIKPKDIKHYINTTDNDINDPTLLGEETLQQGAKMLMQAIANNKPSLVIIDADCDGYTSAAIFINYLYDLFPSYVLQYLHWYVHDGKQHGLADCMDNISQEYSLVICPDSSSNDYEYHKILKDLGINVLVLDHHEAERISENACIINNQLSDYPNKALSGAGVTWQFCRFLDRCMGSNHADDYLDLVALGNLADMMDIRSIETKHLILKGFKEENVKNPFIYGMSAKNVFSLSKADYKPPYNSDLAFTPMGAAFFIAPFVNAMVRSGTVDEQLLLFNSMLKFKAFEKVLSNKRGHKLGETEDLIDQVLRTCTNVKNRQERAVTAGMALLTSRIEKDALLDNAVLLFLLSPGEIDKNIAGLVANKLASAYQRPCAVLTHTPDGGYMGSARGCDATGISNFKDICEHSPGCILAAGHQGAFGLGILQDDIQDFIAHTNKELEGKCDEPTYFVDYIWSDDAIEGNRILDIADMNEYWGQNVNRAYVMIKNFKVCKDNFTEMASETFKFKTASGIDIIKFKDSDADKVEEQRKLFSSTDKVEINAVCKCCANEWNGVIKPQLQMVDFEVVDVIPDWGF